MYEPRSFEIAGIDLIGRRQPDKTLTIGSGTNPTIVKNFPQEILVCGTVYTLEETVLNRDIADLDVSHPGYWIEWGKYV